MSDATFRPYWKALESGSGPNSWLFFAVAQIAGLHRPVAVVSSVGGWEEESLHGPPLVACCRRIATVFADPANHPAVRAELGLAAAYYGAHGGHVAGGPRPGPVELPRLSRRQPVHPRRRRPWDRAALQPFPFISAALLQAVALDPARGRSAPNRPEPLGTVYRDTDIEWGMVVVDVTDPSAVRYGIVGFAVGMAKFVSSPSHARPRFQGASFAFEEGPLRVLDEARPRKAMSAAEYMAKFKYADLVHDASQHDYDVHFLASVPVVDGVALSLVWPSGEKDNHENLVPVNTHGSETSEQSIVKTVEQAFSLADFDLSVFDEVRNFAGFKTSLQQYLLQNPDKVGNSLAAGSLLRFAFTENGHLGLGQLRTFSVQALSAALADGPDRTDDAIKSLSLRIESVRGTPSQLAEVLSQSSGLSEICLLQSPDRGSDTPDAHLFAELASRPQVFSSTKVTFTGAYSAALCKKFWLPTSTNLTPLNVFPVQQILVRHQRGSGPRSELHYDTVHLSDGLLRPEHFAAGFLVWIATLEPRDEWMFEETAPFLIFSSAPATLSEDALSAAELTPILCENLSLPRSMPNNATCAPRARDLAPEGWTAIVSQKKTEVAQSGSPQYLRYAFIRARRRIVLVQDPPSAPLGPEELEVVGLKEFLSITAPHVDPAVVDVRLEATKKMMKAEAAARGTPWPADTEPVSVMNQSEAAAMLLEHLGDDKERNEIFRKAMEEDPESKSRMASLGWPKSRVADVSENLSRLALVPRTAGRVLAMKTWTTMYG